MKKLLTFLILAASPLFANSADELISKGAKINDYAYFFVTNEQTLAAIDNNIYDPIEWDANQSFSTQDVYLDANDSANIIIEDKGIYLVTYYVVADPDGDAYRIGALLNGNLLVGSIYGADTSDTDVAPVFGQFIFEVTEKNSNLELVNAGATLVELQEISTIIGETNTVTASIIIEKINKHRS